MKNDTREFFVCRSTVDKKHIECGKCKAHKKAGPQFALRK